MSDPLFDALGGPIRIRYDGMDADRHEIEMADLAESLKGLSRIIGVAGNFAATEKFVQHKDALAVRVMVQPPEAHCFEVMAWVKWASENSFLASLTAGLTVLLVSYIFSRAAGQREEMRQLRGALDTAIKELGTRDQTVVDKLLGTIDRMADALRPAAKQAVAPIGSTARTLTIGDPKISGGVTLGAAEKDAITSELPAEIGQEQGYTVLITELDMETGSCRWSFADEPETRMVGKITDPSLSLPNNQYALAMAAKRPIKVRGKATLRDGEIASLYISDTVP
jgi:hypothetical protein